MLRLLTAESAVSFTIVLRSRGKPRPSTKGLAAPLGVENHPDAMEVHLNWQTA
ncbi:hypothetical protein LC653_27685 [Nostoc sp. CHAB 5784]|uniref:hypothetical protein n=1 Tax=Nostoc mirabile TaxID=2907820 RepID=UPI001E4405F6|nr:hypothetical protein [Nostoc mirabile]MCC5667560.1 hypothetical protein [Nostoc mirabile CHAB5784]